MSRKMDDEEKVYLKDCPLPTGTKKVAWNEEHSGGRLIIGTVKEAGPQQSLIKWDANGNVRAVPNNCLRPLTAEELGAGSIVPSAPKENVIGSNSPVAQSSAEEASTADNDQPTKGFDMTKKETLLATFGARVGSKREKVLMLLIENLNKPVASKDLRKAAYGVVSEENASALAMVLRGVRVMIEKNKDLKGLSLDYDTENDGYSLTTAA